MSIEPAWYSGTDTDLFKQNYLAEYAEPVWLCLHYQSPGSCFDSNLQKLPSLGLHIERMDSDSDCYLRKSARLQIPIYRAVPVWAVI